MSDNTKVVIAVAFLVLLALWYTSKKKHESMPVAAIPTIPTVIPQAALGADPAADAIAPADMHGVDFGPYENAVAPCTSLQPYT